MSRKGWGEHYTPLESTPPHLPKPTSACDSGTSTVVASFIPLPGGNTTAGLATDFVVTPAGEAIPVPEGASGPTPTANNAGVQYNGGSGGNGLAGNVTDVRIMDPKPYAPNGYVNYGSRQANGGWQSVNPYTGQAVGKMDSWWHILLRAFSNP